MGQKQEVGAFLKGEKMDFFARQSFAYSRKGDGAKILRCFSRDSKVEIPEQIDGLPVRALAPYAFSPENCVTFGGSAYGDSETDASLEDRAPVLCGERLEEVSLPSTLEQVGRYCFYNCHHLKRLEFSGALRDWGSGAFNGCHQVSELCIQVDPDGDSGLKQVLDELPEALTVEFCQKDKKQVYARLIFPDFYEEGVENTPARILETHVHGSGILFRNCFHGKQFDFAQYDRLFPYAQAQENDRLLTVLVLARLRWPYRLEAQTQKTYETYVKAHLLQFGICFLSGSATKGRAAANESGEGLQWFLERFLDPKNAVNDVCKTAQNLEAVLDELSEQAARIGDVQAISRLMEFRRSHMQAQSRRKRLRL